MGYNKKKGSFAYLMWRILKKKTQNRVVNRLSVRVAEFVIMKA